VLALGGMAAVLLPWSAYLTASLPDKHVTPHWDIAWAGFDLFQALALVATLIALIRRSPRLPLFAATAGTGLVADAWFDLITANPGHELRWALVFAFAGELPLAALCFWISYDRTRPGVSAGTKPALEADPPPKAPPARHAAGPVPARTAGSAAPSAGRTSR